MRSLTHWLGDIWYVDELFITIRGERHYLWRAVDQDGDLCLLKESKSRRASGQNRLGVINLTMPQSLIEPRHVHEGDSDRLSAANQAGLQSSWTIVERNAGKSNRLCTASERFLKSNMAEGKFRAAGCVLLWETEMDVISSSFGDFHFPVSEMMVFPTVRAYDTPVLSCQDGRVLVWGSEQDAWGGGGA